MKILFRVYGIYDETSYDVVVSTDDLRFVGSRCTDGTYIQGKSYMPVKPSSFTDSHILFQAGEE